MLCILNWHGHDVVTPHRCFSWCWLPTLWRLFEMSCFNPIMPPLFIQRQFSHWRNSTGRTEWNGHCEPKSVLDVSNALVAEWGQILAASFQNQVDRLKPEEWRPLEWQINGHGFGMAVRVRCPYPLFHCPHTFGHKVYPCTQLPVYWVRPKLMQSCNISFQGYNVHFLLKTH